MLLHYRGLSQYDPNLPKHPVVHSDRVLRVMKLEDCFTDVVQEV